MGNVRDALEAFISNIPDAKLTGFRETGGPIHSDQQFRLHMRGVSNLNYYMERILMI